MLDTEKSLLLFERRFIGFCLISVGFLCLLVGLWGPRFDGWYNSFSNGYWTNARPIFMIELAFVAIFFILYKGYDKWDRIVNTIGGIGLLMIILFPTYSRTTDAIPDLNSTYNLFPMLSHKASHYLHFAGCQLATLSMFVNVRFLFTKHSGEITEKKKQRNIAYKVCAYVGIGLNVMQASLILCWNFTEFGKNYLPIWANMIINILMNTAYGIAWIIKGESLKFFNDK